MKKFARVVNITATVISIITTLALVVLVAIFSFSKDVEVEETKLVVEQIEITRRKANNNISFYAENINRNAKYYIVVAFELYSLEEREIYLTINDTNSIYLIAVNNNQEASIVYNQK